jgi:hypothetical protein
MKTKEIETTKIKKLWIKPHILALNSRVTDHLVGTGADSLGASGS